MTEQYRRRKKALLMKFYREIFSPWLEKHSHDIDRGRGGTAPGSLFCYVFNLLLQEKKDVFTV
jgi:hypothetical protein